MLKRLVTVLLTAVVVIGSFLISAPAYAGYSSLDQIENLPAEKKAKVEEHIKLAMGTMIGLGFTPEAAAGVLSNANSESSMDPSLLEAGKGISKATLDSDPCSIDKSEGSGGIGFFQLDGARKGNQMCWLKDNGYKWDDIKGQLTFTFNVDIKNEDPFASKGYRNQSHQKYCDSDEWSNGSCPDANSLISSFEDFKKIKDPSVAAFLWASIWERPSFSGSVNHMKQRTSMATELFKKYGNTAGISNGADPQSSEGKGGVIVGGGIVDEKDLTGMPDTFTIDGAKGIELKSIDDLDAKQRYQVQAQKEAMNALTTGWTGALQVGITFIGLVMMVWGLLLFMAMLFDKNNNFFELSTVKIMSLGHMEYADEPSAEGQYSGKTIAVRAGIAVGVGLIIVSGTIFGIVSQGILFLGSKGWI